METNFFTIYELLSLSIKEKLRFLRKYDRNYQIFGSRKHQYLLHEPLSEEQIASFEKVFHVKLPDEYRNFIKTVGDGGAGPGYGLFPLVDNAKNSQHPFLNAPFLLENDFDLGTYEEEQPCDSMDCKTCAHKETCLTCETGIDSFKYQQGTLAICFEGCTYYMRLVMNGAMRGELWAESEGDGLKRTSFGFLEWYNHWLDSSIKIILPFVNAVLSSRPFDEIMNIRGSDLFNFNDTKAKFIAGMIGANINLPTNSKKAQEQYLQAVQRAYEWILAK